MDLQSTPKGDSVQAIDFSTKAAEVPSVLDLSRKSTSSSHSESGPMLQHPHSPGSNSSTTSNAGPADKMMVTKTGRNRASVITPPLDMNLQKRIKLDQPSLSYMNPHNLFPFRCDLVTGSYLPIEKVQQPETLVSLPSFALGSGKTTAQILTEPSSKTLASKETLLITTDGKKATRPFKAYPKNPLALSGGPTEMYDSSIESYANFRKRVLETVQEKTEATNTKMRRTTNPGLPTSTSGSHDEKDAAYWEKRKKNNEAAKRSRDARRAKEDEIAIRAAFLEQENKELRFRLWLVTQQQNGQVPPHMAVPSTSRQWPNTYCSN